MWVFQCSLSWWAFKSFLSLSFSLPLWDSSKLYTVFCFCFCFCFCFSSSYSACKPLGLMAPTNSLMFWGGRYTPQSTSLLSGMLASPDGVCRWAARAVLASQAFGIAGSLPTSVTLGSLPVLSLTFCLHRARMGTFPEGKCAVWKVSLLSFWIIPSLGVLVASAARWCIQTGLGQLQATAISLSTAEVQSSMGHEFSHSGVIPLQQLSSALSF